MELLNETGASNALFFLIYEVYSILSAKISVELLKFQVVSLMNMY